MKKKILLLSLVLTLSFSLTGCDSDFWEEDWEETTEVVDEGTDEEDFQTDDADTDDSANQESEDQESEDEEKDSEENVSDESSGVAEVADEPEEEPCPYEGAKQLDFSTEDINGNAVSLEDFADAKLIMLNFWEPWCGPCVGEMPDLERLYEEYKDQGFVIIGSFSTRGEDASVKEVIDYTGVTYPIVRYTQSMEPFTTEYVPTTIFMDAHGHVIVDEPIVGSNSYDTWKKGIEHYLNR